MVNVQLVCSHFGGMDCRKYSFRVCARTHTSTHTHTLTPTRERERERERRERRPRQQLVTAPPQDVLACHCLAPRPATVPTWRHIPLASGAHWQVQAQWPETTLGLCVAGTPAGTVKQGTVKHSTHTAIAVRMLNRAGKIEKRSIYHYSSVPSTTFFHSPQSMRTAFVLGPAVIRIILPT